MAQPLMDLIGRHPGFLVAHRVDQLDLALLVVGLLVIPVVPLLLVELLSSLLPRGVGWAVHLLLVSALVALIAAPVFGRAAALPESVMLGGTIGVGLAAALAYARWAGFRSVVSALALAPIVFVGLFVARVSSAGIEDPAAPLRPAADTRSEVPVILVVLDELPLSSLLTEEGELDARRYPGFARLASIATWFRKATTVHWHTHEAVPAILTGLYPAESPGLPVASSHPNNLFRHLAATHDLNVHELHTKLHASPAPPRLARDRILLTDVKLLYLHIVLPPSRRDKLPPIDRGWKGFQGLNMFGRAKRFRRFTDSVAPGARPGFHFLHIALPHYPWLYLASGQVYSPWRLVEARGLIAPQDPWLAADAWRRHLLQAQFVDRLLGGLLDHLEEVDLLERSLLVVVADHGVDFSPGREMRNLARTRHPAEVLAVPLFIKRPGQTEPLVSMRNAETVDVAPTVAAIAGVPLPWASDGCSLFDPQCPQRPLKTAFVATYGSDLPPLTFPEDVTLSLPSLVRRRKWFGTSDGPHYLFRAGPHAALVGRRLQELPLDPASGVTLNLEPSDRTYITAEEKLLPVRIQGRMRTTMRLAHPTSVAVAVGGVIRTVVPAPELEPGVFRIAALLPERHAPGHVGEAELLLVDGPIGSARVLRLPRP